MLTPILRAVLCALFCLSACAAPAPSADPAGAGQPPLEQRTALPAVGELDAVYVARHGVPSADKQARFLGGVINWIRDAIFGTEQVASSPKVKAKGKTLEITADAERPFGFAVYGTPVPDAAPRIIATQLVGQDGASLIGQDGASLITDNGAGIISQNGLNLVRNYALANFDEERWEFIETSESGIIDLASLPGQPDDYVSPSQLVFVAPLIYSPHEPAKLTISAITALPCDPANTTDPPVPANFLAEPISGGFHISWGDLGSTDVIVQVYFSNLSFDLPDQEGVLVMNYPASDREAVLPWAGGKRVFMRARTHHVRSCRDSELTDIQSPTALAGEVLGITVDVSPAEAEPGIPAIVTASGGIGYEWDLDDDGIFETPGGLDGIAQLSGDGEPGVLRGRVKAHGPDGGLCIRTFSALRRGWSHVQVDPTPGGGQWLQMVTLADGRPAILHWAGEVRYCWPDTLDGTGEWNSQVLVSGSALPNFGGLALSVANDAPVVAYQWNHPFDGPFLEVQHTTSWLGDSSWTTTGINEDYLGGSEFALLGNANSAAQPGGILLAYQSDHDVDDNGWMESDLAVSVGQPDGGGGYSWVEDIVVVEDWDGDQAQGLSHRPQLARVDGIPVMLYNQTEYGPWWRKSFYTYAADPDGLSWSGSHTELTDLYDVPNRRLFNAGDRAAIICNIGGGITYMLGDNVGPAAGGWSSITLASGVGDPIAGNAFTRQNGQPVIFASWIDNAQWWVNGWRFLETDTAYGEQITDWEERTGVPIHIGKTGEWAVGTELGDSTFAIAYRPDSTTGSTVWYATLF